jgi:16S rRNA (cytidine1402-2'-O)-methyltransferase
VSSLVSNKTGCLSVVATPIGNLQDISARALAVLRQVDRVMAEDTRRTRALLQHFAINRPLLALHEHNEDKMSATVLTYLLAGEHLALVTDAGTPLISDPGYPLVRACRAAGVDVTPIPGPSALISALSVSGLPTDRFYFAGFPPRKSLARRDWLAQLAGQTATLVFYEASHRILACLDDMVGILGAQRQATCARELTKLHETILNGELGSLSGQLSGQIKGEFVLVVAGADMPVLPDEAELDHHLITLMAELPLKQAVSLTAKLLGLKKNRVYQRALQCQHHFAGSSQS